jgi:hypothetical protein
MAWTVFSWLRMGPSNRIMSTAMIKGRRLLGRMLLKQVDWIQLAELSPATDF